MALGISRRITKDKIVKDVVHQFIRLPEDFFDTCIDTGLVQRLRKINQLSLTYFVYPGATHTRFEHSIGVAYTMRTALHAIVTNIESRIIPIMESYRNSTDNEVTRKIIDILINYLKKIEDQLMVLEGEAVTAALLHDIGHLALSHTFEEAFNDYIIELVPLTEKLPRWDLDHERLTLQVAELLANNYKIKRKIKDVTEEKVCKKAVNEGLNCIDGIVCYNGRLVNLELVRDVLKLAYSTGDYELQDYCRALNVVVEPKGLVFEVRTDEEELDVAVRRGAMCIIARLLNHSMDVDRADYILRDSIHSGTLFGLYDINRLYSVITVVPRLIGGSEQPNYGRTFYTIEVNLGVLRKGVSIVENMLLSRVYMYSEVYLHDVSMIYSAMASRLLSLLFLTSMLIYYEEKVKGELSREARRVIDKYSIIRGLLGIHKEFLEASRVKGEEEKAEERLLNAVRTVSLVNDSTFYDVVSDIANGGGRELLWYVRSYPDILGGLEESWYSKACVSMSLLSQALWERRHWGAYLLPEGQKTYKAIKMLRDRHPLLLEELRKFMDPLVSVSSVSHVPYKYEDPRARILVFLEHNPLAPVEISEAPNARVVKNIKGEIYSKLLVLYPRSPGSNGMAKASGDWRLKRGKAPTKRHVESASRVCDLGIDEVESIVSGSAHNAFQLVSRLSAALS